MSMKSKKKHSQNPLKFNINSNIDNYGYTVCHFLAFIIRVLTLYMKVHSYAMVLIKYSL